MNSAGRGGVGNLYVGSPVERGILEVEENERVAHQHPPGMYDTFPPLLGTLILS